MRMFKLQVVKEKLVSKNISIYIFTSEYLDESQFGKYP